MRPNHNSNKRMRGRRHGNKPSNPLARSYESNGPDVKVRGNPQHIVEKYSQLARDAQVAGDPVLAEAYLQHAEHYYRIITAAHAAMAQAQGFGRPGDADADEGLDDDEDIGGLQQPYPDFRQQQALQQRQDPGEQPQPEAGAAGFGQRERPPFQERQNFGERGERQPYGERQERGERQPFGERQDRGERQSFGERGERQPYGERQDRGERRFPPRGPRQDFRQRRPDVEGQEGALPSFITGAPRSVNGVEPETEPAPQPAAAPAEEAPQSAPEIGQGEARSPYRTRRRRRPMEAKGDEGELSLDARPEGQPAE